MNLIKQWKQSVAAALCVAALAFGAAPAPVAAQEAEARIGLYPGAILHLPLFVAEAKGLFKAEGVKATLIPIANGAAMNSQLASGSIDFGFQPPSNVGLAREQGLDQVFVVGNVTMPWVLIARKDLKVPNAGKYPAVIADLKGLNWGVYGRGSDGEIFMRVMAADAKLDVAKDMAWIGVGGPPTGLPALKAGQIDVYMTVAPAPNVAAVLGYGKPILDLRKGEGPGDFKGISYNSMVALRKKAAASAQLTSAVVNATIKAQCWLRKPENFVEVVAIAKSRLAVGDLSEKDFAEMVRESLPTFTPTLPASDFKVWNEMLVRGKFLKQAMLPEEVRWKTIPESEPKC